MCARIAARWLLAALLCGTPLCASASASVEALLKQADSIRSADPKTFQQLLVQLNTQRAKATPAQQEHLAYLNAYAQAYAGRFDAAIVEARQLLDTTRDVGLKYRAGALIVNSYAATRQFIEGLRQLEQTLALADQVKDPEVRQQGLAVAAVLYNQVGQPELGQHYAEQILAAPASGRAKCYAGMLRLEALLALKTLPNEDEPITEVVEQCRRQHEPIWTNLSRSTLARKWAAQGQRKRALALLQKYSAETAATRYPRLIGEVESLQAEFLLAEGDIDGAEVHAKASIAQSAGIVNSLPLVMAYKNMYEIALRRGDSVAALLHYRDYAEADKAYLNDVKARELAYQLVHHETLQKTQQIELLARQNQVLQLQQRLDRKATQNSQLIATLMAVLLASIGYWAYKTKRMQLSFRRLAETDTLTGISNRHHFTRQAEEALAYCAKTQEDVGLIMFDLDNFKAINDRYGHGVGDFVLRKVAETCKNRCRKNDRIGRLGGEEFAILLIGCDLDTASRMAQACRTTLAEMDTRECGHQFPVTASFGVTAASLSGYEFTRMLSHADELLYRSKHGGRNRVSVIGPTALTDPQVEPQAV